VEGGPVMAMWLHNGGVDVPPIPEDARLLRLHVSGDFDTVDYINTWIARLTQRADVTMWCYTRSWRVPELLPALERLRALPNVQMFASMDVSTPELPPKGWRRAWIDGDERAGSVHKIMAHTELAEAFESFALQKTNEPCRWCDGGGTSDADEFPLTCKACGGTGRTSVKALICPEETKAVKNCVECGFCISGLRNDVIFLEH
jgi:hypothetical protein